MTKRRFLTRHARIRVDERLGFDLTRERQKQIVQQIKNGKATLIKRQGAQKFVYRVNLDGVSLKVVYHKATQSIITVLT